MTDPVRAALRELEDLKEQQVSPVAADAMEVCIERIRTALAERDLGAVTLREAAEIGGYSYSRLQELVGERIENVGEPGAPRIRRSDVPVKPGASRRDRRRGRGKARALDSELEDVRDRREKDS